MNIVNGVFSQIDNTKKKYNEIKKSNPVVSRIDRSIQLVNAYEDLGPGKINAGPIEFEVYQESDRIRNEIAMEKLKQLEAQPVADFKNKNK